MATYAVIKDNLVINSIVWDEVSDWAPPAGCILVKTDKVGPGHMYDPDTNTFSAPIIIEEQALGE